MEHLNQSVSGIHIQREIVRTSLPLVMSMAAVTVMEFTDRVFLSNYRLDAIAAATPAGIAAFLLIAFFAGVATYLSVFIAQYTGAGAHHRLGTCVWQAIYFSLLAGLIMIGLSFTAKPMFAWIGHPAPVQVFERTYFSILCQGGGIYVAGAGLASFFAGRGMTRPVLLAHVTGMLVNVPLDYALINGVGVFPEMGIAGAALATVIAWGLITLILAYLIFRPEHEAIYRLRSSRSFDAALFARWMRFGLPGSLQFCLDILAFAFFVFMVGRIGKDELAATNIVFSINSLAFMPAMGFSQGVSILTGQALGAGRIEQVTGIVRGTLKILLGYILVLVSLFILAPHWAMAAFIPAAQAEHTYRSILDLGTTLLRIVALYISFDACYMVLVGVLKGAGDTRFIMWSIAVSAFLVMILPLYVGVTYLGGGIYFAWGCVTLFIFCLFALSLWRFRQAKWKTMRVVEKQLLPRLMNNGIAA
jgi:MATE family multidrug resistance protein